MITIIRLIGGLPEFMTFHKDYTIGGEGPGWSGDATLAFQFGRVEDAKDLMNKFRNRWFDHRCEVHNG